MQRSQTNWRIDETRVLSDAEAEAVEQKIKQAATEQSDQYAARDALMFRVMAETGARGCEVVGNQRPTTDRRHVPGIRPMDITPDCSIILHSAKKRHASQRRVIPIPAHLYRDLLLYVRENNIATHERIFPMTPDHLRARWRSLRPAGVTKGTHAMRHRFATQVYLESKNLAQLQELLGHANLETPAAYLDYCTKRVNIRANVLNRKRQTIDTMTVEQVHGVEEVPDDEVA